MIYIEGGGSGGGTRASLTKLTTANAASPVNTPGTQGRRVIALWGDSNAVGFSASQENAAGFRRSLQRKLMEAGIWFRMVGVKGFGALNGTGTTWGRYPNPEDFHHDAWQFHLLDWRCDGHGGRLMSASATVSSINTGTGVVTTTAAHGLIDGALLALRSTGTLPTVTGISPTTGTDGNQYIIGWATGCTTTTFQISLYDGSTATGITAAGSGTITVAVGLAELVPAVWGTYDEAPTDVILIGGTNDISTLVDASASNIATTVQAHSTLYFDAIDAACAAIAPSARRYAISLLPIVAPAANQASKATQVTTYNAYLAANVASRGSKWAYVDATSTIGAAEMAAGDGYHPYSYGYNKMGSGISRAIIASSGFGAVEDEVPRHFARRAQQACFELRATTDNIRFPNQASITPGSNSFFVAAWFMPFDLKSGTNAIIQMDNPYNNGALISCTNSNLLMYWRSAGTCIPSSNYTAVLKKYRWHRLFACFDRAKSQAALFLNGQLIQRVYTTASDAPATNGWYLGGGGLNSAPGLYQGFLFGAGSSVSIENAARDAWRDYWLGIYPAGTTASYLIDDGSGTAATGELQGATNGIITVTTGGWVASGRYPKPVDTGYRKPQWDKRIATYTDAATLVPNEYAAYDCTSGAFAFTMPAASSCEGQDIYLAEVGGSGNTLTITPAGTDTVDVGTIASAGTRRIYTSKGNGWVSRPVSSGSGDIAPIGTTVWTAASSVASSTYAGGVAYVPLRDAQTDTISWQFVSSRTGTIALALKYAMSSAQANGVRMRFDKLILGTGADPTASPTAGTAFTVTMAADVLTHEITSSNSSDLSFSVTAGDTIYCVLTRLGTDGADTHTGDLRAIEARVY